MGKAEIKFRDAFEVGVVALCIGIIIVIFLRLEVTTGRRIVMEANKCYARGERAVFVMGEVQCRK